MPRSSVGGLDSGTYLSGQRKAFGLRDVARIVGSDPSQLVEAMTW